VKSAAKWVLILWSLFCLFGVVVGMSNVGKSMEGMSTDPERTGATIGLGCGMAMWVGIWAAIALPALVIFLVSGKAPPQIPTTSASGIKLCAKCGKYYDGNPTFCPNCGCQLVR
jgi:membrane protease subunit (stomatin/prohibitin family)